MREVLIQISHKTLQVCLTLGSKNNLSQCLHLKNPRVLKLTNCLFSLLYVLYYICNIFQVTDSDLKYMLTYFIAITQNTAFNSKKYSSRYSTFTFVWLNMEVSLGTHKT